MRFLTLRSLFYSLLIHVVVVTALILNFDAVRRPVMKPRPKQNIVEAVTVDDSAVEKELQRLRELEREKQQAMEKKLRELEQKAGEAEDRRRKEERKQQAVEQKRKEEERKTAAERARREAEKRRAEAELKRIEEENRKAEAERRRIEEEKRRAEAERRRIEEEKRRAEAEQKRIEEEKRKQAAQEALEKQRAREQREQDKKALQNIITAVYHKVAGNFNKTGLPKGLECVLSVQTVPGGEVISVTLSKSSGNDVFDRRAMVAVEKASPLPLPRDAATFERLRLRKFNFRFNPKD